jgi:hypothetical protein
MGFFSWKDCTNGTSIPAPYGLDKDLMKHNSCVLLLPNGENIIGSYDGYGNIKGINIFAIMEFITHHNGNVEGYSELSDIEELRNDGIDHFIDSGIRIIKTINALKVPPHLLKYDQFSDSKNCEFQGYFYEDMSLDITGKKKRVSKKEIK